MCFATTLYCMNTALPPTGSDETRRVAGTNTDSESELNNGRQSASKHDMLLLFRLLMKEPPQGHDFGSCEICKRHGITGI